MFFSSCVGLCLRFAKWAECNSRWASLSFCGGRAGRQVTPRYPSTKGPFLLGGIAFPSFAFLEARVIAGSFFVVVLCLLPSISFRNSSWQMTHLV